MVIFKSPVAMTRITNYTLTAGRSTGKGYFQERFRSIVTILITIFSLAFALIVIVFGEKILYVVLSGLEVMLNVKYEVDNVWMGLRWVFAFCTVLPYGYPQLLYNSYRER